MRYNEILREVIIAQNAVILDKNLHNGSTILCSVPQKLRKCFANENPNFDPKNENPTAK